MNVENLILQACEDSVQSTQEFRVYLITQGTLWVDSLEVPEETECPSMELGVAHGKYIGGRWGGKYLPAPDIFFTILEKGKGKLVRQGDIAEVCRGLTTGDNESFYLQDITDRVSDEYLARHGIAREDTNRLRLYENGAGWEGLIEAEFLKPVIISPREANSMLIRPDRLNNKIFMCNKKSSDIAIKLA